MLVQTTMLDQIRATDKWALGSWAARDFKGSENTLFFRVNGTKLKRGWIEITYNVGLDTYTVRGMYQHNMEMKLRENFEGVYWDSLVQVIDSIVG